MIYQTPRGWEAIHIPSSRRVARRFDTALGAKCWMLVMDDRHQTSHWRHSVVVVAYGGEPALAVLIN